MLSIKSTDVVTTNIRIYDELTMKIDTLHEKMDILSSISSRISGKFPKRHEPKRTSGKRVKTHEIRSDKK